MLPFPIEHTAAAAAPEAEAVAPEPVELDDEITDENGLTAKDRADLAALTAAVEDAPPAEPAAPALVDLIKTDGSEL